MRDGLQLEISLLSGKRGSDYVANQYHKRRQLAIFTFQAVCECSDILPGEDCLDIKDRSHEVFYPGRWFIALCRREMIIYGTTT